MNMPVTIPAKLSDALVSAAHLVVLTGSGISAESGIPTFREAQTGLWQRFDPLELATPTAFATNPQLVWDWYAWRRQLIADAKPNLGHQALVALQKYMPRFTLITQNVDGLHQLAGSYDVLELHGNIRRTICSVERIEVTDWPSGKDAPPRCPDCQAPLRPDVVWFGESLRPEKFKAAVEASEDCDLFLSVGTSAIVEPAASLAHIASRHGAFIVEVNTGKTPLTQFADESLIGPAGVLLPALLKILS